MNIMFALLLCVLTLLLYYSNKENKANKWCAFAGGLFSLGVLKESFLYDLVPMLQVVFPNTISERSYIAVYSLMTWALYSFAMHGAVVFSMYFCDLEINYPRAFYWGRRIILIPPLVFSFFFPPLVFQSHQLNHVFFWQCYSAYNLFLGVLFLFFLIRGVTGETKLKAKKQKRTVAVVFIPPVMYWLVTIFIIHPLGLSRYFKLWQGNIIIIGLCIIAFIGFAFKDGMMGLRLRGENYRWNSDMKMINKGAEYTEHMLKNQTSKMEWCIDNLRTQYHELYPNQEEPEELAILSRSVTTVKDYFAKKKRYSDHIILKEERCQVKRLLLSAISEIGSAMKITVSVQDDVMMLCDRTHMKEVFENVLNNAVEASAGEGEILITEGTDRDYYLLQITDQGCGMSEEEAKKIFTPYFTTKNTEFNFGLGLAYCQSVLESHGGTMNVESKCGEGTSIILCIPKKRMMKKGETREWYNQSFVSRG